MVTEIKITIKVNGNWDSADTYNLQDVIESFENREALTVKKMEVIPSKLAQTKMVKFEKTFFQVNDEVILKANAEENWPEESGVIIEVQDQNKYPGMYIVQVIETPLKMEDGDDGIREIHEDNIRLQ